MASSRGKAESQVITRDFVTDGIKMWTVTPFLPGQGDCTPIKTLQPRNVPWLAPPWRRHLIGSVGAERPSTWSRTSQNLGRNDRIWGRRGADRPGADRLRGKVRLTDALLRRILHVSLDALTHRRILPTPALSLFILSS